MVMDAQGHEDHLEYIKEYVVQDSYDGKQFKTVDGVCWEVYKSPHGNITSYARLHVREVTCNEDVSSDILYSNDGLQRRLNHDR